MKERPILFSGEMVKAILEGRKTQTRRVTKDQGEEVIYKWVEGAVSWPESWKGKKADPYTGWAVKYPNLSLWLPRTCPYGQPGDRLWVKETTWRNGGYVASDPPNFENEGKRPSIFMSRQASRITLEITGVRVERLQDISERDCCLETGAPLEYPGAGPEPYKRNMWAVFHCLWDSINGKRPGCSWQDNPFVWVIEFKKAEAAR